MKISAVIPVFNGEKTIARAIDSVLAQTRPADEIIVVDDGSIDKTAQVVRSYGDKVTLIQQENAGASAARNAGIETATCDWIAFLDGDDEWMPDMLQRQNDILIHNPDLVWTSGNYKLCFCQKGYDLLRYDPIYIQEHLNNKLYFDDYLKVFSLKIPGWTCCMVIRKDILEEVGMFSENLPKANDVDMWFRIAYRYPKIGFTADPLAVYHMEAGDCLSNRPMMYDYLESFLQKHLALAQEAGRLDTFSPVAIRMLRAWIRSAFFDDRVYDVRKAVCQFNGLLSKRYKIFVYAMTILPGFTKYLVQTLSWLCRTFNLRQQTWHPSVRYKRK